jgi:hypothetical protein
MRYLAKLANRLSLLKDFVFVAVLASACSTGDKADFLSPNPDQIKPTLARIRVTPQVATVKANEPFQFTAVGEAIDGRTVPTTVDWAAISGGTITSDGKFTASKSGQYRVRAAATTNSSIRDSALAGVWELPTDVLFIDVTPDAVELTAGEGVDLDAMTKVASGTVTRTDALIWTATGGSVDGSGWFTSFLAGDYQVRAIASNGVSGMAMVRVRDRKLDQTSLRVSPDPVTLKPAESRQFVANASWSDGSTSPTNEVVWSSTGGSISNKGLYKAGGAAGTFQVIARQRNGTLADTAQVQIDAAQLIDVQLSPSSVSLAAGASQSFTAQGTLSDGSTLAVSVSWAATGGNVNPNGSYTAGTTAGNYRVVATVSGAPIADTALVTVTSSVATLSQIILNPSSASVPAGDTRQFSVTGVWSDGSNDTPAVTWSATGGSVTADGLFTAGAATGTFRVIAAGSGKADTSVVTVTAPVLRELSLSPATVSVASGAAQPLSLAAVWSDGSTTVPSVTWTAAGGTMSGNQYQAGSDAGTYSVVARHQASGLADTSLVTVTIAAPTLTALSLTPGTLSLQPGGAQQFAVSGTYSNGTTGVPAVTWSATGGTISPSGMYTAGTAAGTFRVIASAGSKADTSAVTISASAPTLTVLDLSPSSASLQTGGTRQFSVTGTWSDGSTTTPSVTWAATGGTISSSGMYTAGSSAGTFRVIAKQLNGAKADTAAITLTTPPTLTAVSVTPATASVATTKTQQFSATAVYSNGGQTAASVAWTATGGTVSSAGLYTAGTSSGTFRVIGRETVSGKADTSFVTVSGATPTLTGILVSPSSVSMMTGGQQQFSATALFSDATTSPAVVTWSATGGSITSSGLFSAGSSTGTFRVIAAGNGKADTSTVSIASAPAPGQYQTIKNQDWKNFADKSAIAGMIGVEGQLNTQAPALPNTAFYDLVGDPVFGKVVRYHGGPHLNTTSTTAPGRVATHSVALGTCVGRPNASWYQWTNGCWYPTHVWVRQFIRFSPNWTNFSATGGSGSGDYKTMFLTYIATTGRHEFKVTNLREWIMGWGGPTGNSGPLPWNNVQSMNDQYNTSGFLGVDLFPMVRPSAPDGRCFPSNTPCGPAGDGEWYEMVMHHKTTGARGEFSQYLRRYSQNGVVSPGPWRINAHYVDAAAGGTFTGIDRYMMGVNRNRQYDSVMYHDWGPYEVVDGGAYPNPWGVPGN